MKDTNGYHERPGKWQFKVHHQRLQQGADSAQATGSHFLIAMWRKDAQRNDACFVFCHHAIHLTRCWQFLKGWRRHFPPADQRYRPKGLSQRREEVGCHTCKISVLALFSGRKWYTVSSVISLQPEKKTNWGSNGHLEQRNHEKNKPLVLCSPIVPSFIPICL